MVIPFSMVHSTMDILMLNSISQVSGGSQGGGEGEGGSN